jgi:hypothetical protein
MGREGLSRRRRKACPPEGRRRAPQVPRPRDIRQYHLRGRRGRRAARQTRAGGARLRSRSCTGTRATARQRTPAPQRSSVSKPLRKIAPDEFARRLKRTTQDADKRFAFFLGAGCSVSSGISDAASLVRDEWLPRLRDFRAPQRADLAAWAKDEFPDWDPHNAAAFYGPVMEKLFLHPEERQREIERLCDGRFPGRTIGVTMRGRRPITDGHSR